MKVLAYPAVLAKKDGRVLLGYYRRGYDEDLWAPFSGSLGDGEEMHVGAYRVLKEQSGLTAGRLERFARVAIKFAGVKMLVEMTVFLATDVSGELKTNPTLVVPQWFKPEEIPCSDVRPDLPFWILPVLAGLPKKLEIEHNGTLVIHLLWFLKSRREADEENEYNSTFEFSKMR